MAIFDFEKAKGDQISGLEQDCPGTEKIFDKYVRLTLENIEQSLSDARSRYEKGNVSVKPSQNWKVVKKSEKLIDEEVKVWLKIGLKKQGLFVNRWR